MTVRTQTRLARAATVRVGRTCLSRYREVLLDCDGVLLDFSRHALKYHGAENVNYPRNVYSLATVLGISETDFWKKIDNAGFWNSVPAYAGSDAFLRSLHTLCASGGVSLAFCTRSSENIAAFAAARVKILRNLCRAAGIAGNLPVYICYQGGKSVFSGPGRLLIDDHDKYLCDFEVGGGATLKVPMQWNTPAWETPEGCRVGMTPDYKWLTAQVVRLLAGEGTGV